MKNSINDLLTIARRARELGLLAVQPGTLAKITLPNWSHEDMTATISSSRGQYHQCCCRKRPLPLFPVTGAALARMDSAYPISFFTSLRFRF